MSTIINFEKDEAVKELDLATIRESVSLTDWQKRKLPTKPVEPWEYADIILEAADKKNLSVKMDPIIVKKDGSRQVMWKGNKDECPISNWFFNHLIMSFQFTGGKLSDKLMNTRIGLNYTDKGIEVAFGQNIKVCSNMSIMSAERRLTTFGKDKMDYKTQVEMIEGWMARMEEMSQEDRKVLKQMQDTVVAGNAIPGLVGNLLMDAVKQAYVQTSFSTPLNIGQVSSFTKEVLLRGLEEDRTVYELMNFGTGILKPHNVHTNDLFMKNVTWIDFLKRNYLELN